MFLTVSQENVDMSQCRLCGELIGQAELSVNLYNKTSESPLILIIEKHLGISLQDRNEGLPNRACKPCITRLQDWENFYEKCSSVETKFRNRLSELSEKSYGSSRSYGRKIEKSNISNNLSRLVEELVETEYLKEESAESVVHSPESENISDQDDAGRLDNSDSDDIDLENEPEPEIQTKRKTKKTKRKTQSEKVRREKFTFTLEYLERKTKRKFTESETEQLQKYINNKQNTLIYEMLIGGGPDQDWQCQICNENLKGRASEVQVHYSTVHNTEPLFPCQVCSYTSRTEKMYQAHRMSHLIEYPCTKCGKVFAQHSRLVYHMNSHTNQRTYECNTCHKRFNTLQYLTNHERKVHGDQEVLLKYTCELCGMRFKYKNHLTYHQKRHPTVENPLPYSCKYCDERFASRAEQLAHSNTVHAEEGEYVCEHCGKKMKTSLSLQNHVKLHTGVKEFECEMCNAAFATEHSLKCHRKIHSRPAKSCLCPVCGKAMSNKSSLNQHIKTHLGTKPFQCSFCEASFIHKNRLDIHMRKHTGESPHICVDCGKAFRSTSSMNSHRQYVHSEKKFTCPVPSCAKAFKTTRDLKTHATLHTGEKPNICPVCGKAFRVRANYFKHRKIHDKAAQQQATDQPVTQVIMISDPAINSADGAPASGAATDFFPFAPEQQWAIV